MITSKLATQLHIGGHWCDALDGRTLQVINPATEELLANVADGGTNDALLALHAAKDAAEHWRSLPARQRSDVLYRAFQTMTGQRESLADLISSENGKIRADALAEVDYAAEYFRWYAEEGVRHRGELFESPNGANRVLVTYEPVGVCVLVTPWNFPAAMAARKIAPALAAGCTAVLKPAAETPLTALRIAEILIAAGLPSGALNVLITSSPEPVVGALLSDPSVRMVSFTGSTEVGKQLLNRAAGRVMKTAMELGGNAPFVVFDDANVSDAVEGAMLAKMRNGGQACTAANRFYIQRGIHDDFVAGLRDRMASLQCGEGTRETTDCGPLISKESLDKVDRLVKDALGRGAQALVGGAPLAGVGHFYPPTILTGVPTDAAILHQEVFGPVAPIVSFESEAEAISAANDTPYGLVSYLYTGDLSRGLRLASRLEAGMVALNRGLVSDPAAPFGGVKESGLGREGSHEGLLEYLEPKYVATQW